MKTWMRNALTYVLALACLFAGLCWTVRTKERTVGDAYRDIPCKGSGTIKRD